MPVSFNAAQALSGEADAERSWSLAPEARFEERPPVFAN
jgi:hypothetical protein